MSIIGSNMIAGASGAGAGDYQISRSVRLRSSASAYFSRTPSAGNRKTWTWSGWVKRGALSPSLQYTLFSCHTANNDNASLDFHFIEDFIGVVGWSSVWRKTSAVFRDSSAWHHIVLSVDTTQATANNRLRLYVNGVEITSWQTLINPSQNADIGINQASQHTLGASDYSPEPDYLDGYLTEVNFIDGQALPASSFGEINAITGVWSPKQYTGTYGTNGFYLNFSDNSAATAAAIGKDSSGNGNNWTPNNISVTSGVTYDSMLDVPTRWGDGGGGRGNYASLSVIAGTGVLSSGNLSVSDTIYRSSTVGMIGGKWYCEVTAGSVVAESYVGVVDNINDSNTTGYIFWGTGGSFSSIGGTENFTSNTITEGDIIGISFDGDNGTWGISRNGSALGEFSGLSYGPAPWFFNILTNVSASNPWSINFGQRAFSYPVPSGFKALNTQNIPNGSVVTSGNFTGNLSVDGPVIWLNGVPTAMSINGNSVTFGTHADRLATGFKVRSSSALYNNSIVNAFSITTTGAVFKHANAQVNP